MQLTRSPIYQSAQIREIERIAAQQYAIPPMTLMLRAGKAAFEYFLKRFANAQKIAVFCGRGNNGGDGYIFAKLAEERGLQVRIWQIGGAPSADKKEAHSAFNECLEAQIPIEIFHDKAEFNHSDVLIDAITGIGLTENLRDDLRDVIRKLKSLSAPIFALDAPTGVNGDTGAILGDALRATATMTFIGLKVGLLTGEGASCVGDLVMNDLQLPTELFTQVVPVAERMNVSSYSHYLKPRARNFHKGLSGHVLIIGGGEGMSGASRMASIAALRVGAGLVTLATHPAHSAYQNMLVPELMCYGVENRDELTPLLTRADVVVIGPGLGQSMWAKNLFAVIDEIKQPLLIDGDGLNLLAQQPHQNKHWILTPHPGEAARLLNTNTANVQADRLEALKKLHAQYNGVIVLKGAGTLVSGSASFPALCDKGNPGMATAGMGDVLSGVIGGLLAQHIPLEDAAKLGVALHAAAGDMAAKEGERGMLATDLFPFLRRLVNYTNGN